MPNKLVLETNGLQVGTNQLVAQAGSITIGRDLLVGGGIKTATTGNPLSLSTSNGEQLRVLNLQNNTTSVNRYVEISGGVSGLSAPGIGTGGGQEVLDIYSNNNAIWLSTGGGKRVGAQVEIRTGGDGTNYLSFTGGTNGNPVQINALGGNTNIPLVLAPKGTGALQAQLNEGTATGGNARGANAVDWQTSRGSASQVASGQYAVISGGTQNSASAFTTTAGGGFGNNASGYSATIAGGTLNTGSGAHVAIAGGNQNTASQFFGFVGGGYQNNATGYYNVIGGGQSNSGTANAAVTTQAGTANATTTLTLDSSNAAIKIGQAISGTHIATNTYVANISGTTLTLSQAASGSGAGTLSFYTPHGVVVGGGNNQATGSYSFIGGGGDGGTAANRNVASGDWSVVVGGVKNTASGGASFVGGGGWNGSGVISGNTASAVGSAVVAGNGNQAQSSYAFVAAGFSNLASGRSASVLSGEYGTTRNIIGNTVFAASQTPISATLGVQQAALLVLGAQTTDATATALTSSAAAAGTTNQVILPNNSAYYFRGTVVAGVTGGGDTKGWFIEGVIKRGANAAATALVGTATVTSNYANAGASAWSIAVTADTTNGGLAVTFTGQAGTTIRCVAKIETTEMTF